MTTLTFDRGALSAPLPAAVSDHFCAASGFEQPEDAWRMLGQIDARLVPLGVGDTENLIPALAEAAGQVPATRPGPYQPARAHYA